MDLPCSPRLVAVARTAGGAYGCDGAAPPASAPESPQPKTAAFQALTAVFESLGLDASHRGAPGWNPLGDVVKPGARVVVKPNWVLHRNNSGSGTECLVTHWSVLDAVLHYLLAARPGRVTLGDAPVQGCDFPALRASVGADALAESYRARGLELELCDFRHRASLEMAFGGTFRDRRDRDAKAVLVDLGAQSLLEPLSHDAPRFRVTRYDPRRMRDAHRPGTHRYSIAREVLDADVVISVPKLKCHMKAAITGALKNLIGINGDKDYLPHHRKGGSRTGGDCYEGAGLIRPTIEHLYDLANRFERNRPLAAAFMLPIKVLNVAGKKLRFDTTVEGAWHGNDTIWRTCLDLHRVLVYGRNDGTLADTPQRTLFSITDAIVAGEGEGPLAPTPIESAFVTAGLNPVAVDWVNARLMGFDPHAVPLLREAMRLNQSLPLLDFGEDDIVVRGLPGVERVQDVRPLDGRTFLAPRGWRGHIELQG